MGLMREALRAGIFVMSYRCCLGVMAALGFGGCGVRGVVGPGLGCAPGAGGGEVDAEGAGGAVGGQDLGEAVANLREGGGEGVQAGDGGHAGEVQGVAGRVELAVENCGIFAAKREGGGGEEESAEGWGGRLFCCWLFGEGVFFVLGVGGG